MLLKRLHDDSRRQERARASKSFHKAQTFAMLTNKVNERLNLNKGVLFLFIVLALIAFVAANSGSSSLISIEPRTTQENEGDDQEWNSDAEKNANDLDYAEDEIALGEEIPEMETPHGEVVAFANRPTSKDIADKLINDLIKKIGAGQGPIIVGGVGDSGTRGVRDVLVSLGSQMLNEPYVNRLSKDSKIYMAAYTATTSDGRVWWRNPSALYNAPISNLHSLKYGSDASSFEWWNCGKQYVAKMLSKTMSLMEQEDRPLDPWGFKHPRTALLLPFWHSSMGRKFKFIHVLRDGKDVIEGDNEKLYNDHCEPYYGRPCDKSLKQRLDFWADLNREIFEYAMESSMAADQYLAIRTEDIVAGNYECFKRLATFIGLTDEQMNLLVPRAVDSSRGHMSSYYGSKWKDDVKLRTEHVADADAVGSKQLQFWGYNTKAYGLSLHCEELPWLQLTRNKKGPLPGDA